MKAMPLKSPAPIGAAPLQMADLPPLVPGLGEILIRVDYCGRCHTDLHTVEGEVPLERLPVIPGHQVVGQVMECGPEVMQFQRPRGEPGAGSLGPSGPGRHFSPGGHFYDLPPFP